MIKRDKLVALYCLLSPLRALSAVASAWALGAAVDYAQSGQLLHIWKYVLIFSAYILTDMAVDIADQWVRLKLTQHSVTLLKGDLHRRLIYTKEDFFLHKSTAEYLSNMSTDVETIRGEYFEVLLNMYADFLRGVVAIGMLVWLSPALGIFALATSLAQALVPLLYAKKLEQNGKSFSDAQEAQMSILKDNLSGFRTGKTFHMEERLQKRYWDILQAAEGKWFHARFMKEQSCSVSYIFNQIGILGNYLIGAVLSIQGTITLAEVVAASELISYISSPILLLNRELASLRTAKIAEEKLLTLLNAPEDKGGSEELACSAGELQLQNVSFYYGDRKILDNISFRFQQGKKYLILGSTGSGKSTLLDLLSGLLEGYSGEILLSGVSIQRLTRECFTRNALLLDQEAYLFDDTLRENIRLYQDIPDDSLKEVLKRVGLEEKTRNLPQGLDTPLGERGQGLSGGEKQRVLLARVLLSGAPILLLDESTSHLDPITASEIEKLVFDLDGITVLLVSHNATDTAYHSADEILELCSGKIRSLVRRNLE